MTMGRPTKLNPETQAKIVNALSAGNYFDTACMFADIDESTGYRWMQRGEAEIKRREGNVKEGTAQWQKAQPFVEFYKAVKAATARAEVAFVAKVRQAATQDDSPGQWQAAAWWLERRRPDMWGRRVNQTTHDGGLEVEIIYTRAQDKNQH